VASEKPGAATANQLQKLVQWSEDARLAHTIEGARQLVVESVEGLDRARMILSALPDVSDTDRDAETWVDLNEGLENTINVAWNELKDRVTLHREYGKLPKVLCYPRQMNQVFLNLLVTAAQAIPEHGDIWVKTWADAENVHVDIRNIGAMHSGELRPEVSASLSSVTPVGQETGLGLRILCGIVERQGGALRVTGLVGTGTTAHLSVPIKRCATAA
jgi:signal transduction histidine kinase